MSRRIFNEGQSHSTTWTVNVNKIRNLYNCFNVMRQSKKVFTTLISLFKFAHCSWNHECASI